MTTNALPNPELNAFVQTAVRTVGLALAAYLALLPLLSLPCWGGHCGAVLGSSYSKLLGIPVGFFGTALWVMTLGREYRLRIGAHYVLALGSLVFMGLQVFVLRKLCPACTAHAALSWAAWLGRRHEMRRGRHVIGFASLIAATIIGGQYLALPRAITVPPTLILPPPAFDWLEPRRDSSDLNPILALSLSCPTCLDWLGEFANDGWPTGIPRPQLIWHTTPQDRQMVATLTAAIDTHPAGGVEAFPAMLPFVLAQPNLLLAAPNEAARLFVHEWNPSPTAIEAMTARLAKQQKWLDQAGVITTPAWIAADGKIKSRIPSNSVP